MKQRVETYFSAFLIALTLMLIVDMYYYIEIRNAFPRTVLNMYTKLLQSIDMNNTLQSKDNTSLLGDSDLKRPFKVTLKTGLRNFTLLPGESKHLRGNSSNNQNSSDPKEYVAVRSTRPKTFPLSIRKHPYNIENSQICRGMEKILFLVLVHTATTHFYRRNSIRETWANASLYKEQEMRIIFLLGLPTKEAVQAKIEQENAVHKDIVQGKFIDTYHNLTHKGVL